MYVTWLKEYWEEKKDVTIVSWKVLLWKIVCLKEHWEGRSLAIGKKHPKVEFWGMEVSITFLLELDLIITYNQNTEFYGHLWIWT